MELYNRLCTITKQENVMKDEPMKKHTTFRIGGPADYFVTPESKEEIQAIVELCKKEEIPYSVIGNGSNLLVRPLQGQDQPPPDPQREKAGQADPCHRHQPHPGR